MKHLLLVFVCVSTLSCGFTQKNKEKFSNSEGRFRIDFPEDPKSSEAAISNNYAKQVVYSFYIRPKNDANLFYEVRYIDFPDEVLVDFDGEKVFDLFLSLVKGEGNLSSRKSLGTINKKIVGYPGREYRWQNLYSSTYSRMVFYMVGNRLYQLTVETSAEENHNKAIDQFFDSFELVDTEPNPSVKTSSKSFKLNSYSIDFPYPTEKKEMETLTEYGNAKIFVEGSQHSPEEDLNVAYTMVFMKYPKDITKSENFNLKNHYNELVQTGLTNRQSQLVSQEEITLDGIKGVATKESFKNGQIIINQQSFLMGDTQVVVSVMTIPKNDDNIDQKEFFWSLRLK